MKLSLFNSLKNQITELELQPNQTIKIYLCGPTVYDHIHIGNLRSVIIFDVLHRLLLCLKVKVNYIQNITDIDDKIITKAQKEKKSEKEIVTNYIPQLQTFIKKLLEKGFAYQLAGEIFFGVKKSKEYGRLSGQKLEKLKSGQELASENKKDNKDFEFFAGQTIDIHGGGNDLLFPHHENERIQYLAHNNKELTENFSQKYDPNVLRYLILNSHYNQVINLSEELIQQAVDYTQKIKNLLKKLNFYLYTEKIKITPPETPPKKEIIDSLLNNLNIGGIILIFSGSPKSDQPQLLETIIIEPTQKHSATVIFLHGLGNDATRQKNELEPIAKNYPQVKFIFPKAPTIPQDKEGLRKSVKQIEKIIRQEIDCGISPQKIMVMGHSQGGSVALTMGLLTEYKLAGIVCLSGFLPCREEIFN
ncbi:5543_t:CDS:2 [Funneliformis geosporum]|uniref:5543_t:CDS:1 n=1 Tax=Funneliformis geosporum TaxID=1117311 RepID=A0A9W4WT70_9GLOM|nr:5543_t:CDS:2 [Funneliformis geosporum]